MPRQERRQMSRHTDRAYPWTTTTVGDAERFVQIQMANIGTEGSGSRETHLRIEIGAIEIHLTAVAMDHLTDMANPGFKHPMG